MAAVYRAFDRVEQRLVALKAQSCSERAGPAHPLSAEFDFWTRLKHPNIVEAYDLAVSRRGPIACGTPYLVLEHVEGAPVHRSLEPGRISADALERLSVELLCGLQHVHDAGLVHRDLKPGNILVEKNGGRRRIKLTDFGLATTAGEAEEVGRISGSIPYVAPESLLGLPLDCRADLYALGIVLYHLATGETPVAGGSVDDVLRWHLGGPPADPRRLRPRFSERLARFVRRLTARDRDLRPASATEALSMLHVEPRALRGNEKCVIPVEDLAVRASLRLALDAVRLGARRIFRLSSGHRDARPLVRQARVWAQVHGLGFHDPRGRDEADHTGLVRMVLSLLLRLEEEGRDLMRRYALERWLPLTSVAGVPVADPTRIAPAWRKEAVRPIVRFILDSSDRHGLVLLAPDPTGACPLTRAVIDQLGAILSPPRPPTPAKGGLLLLH
jgi:hypothetical protein